MQQVGGRKLKTLRYKGGVEDDNLPPLSDVAPVAPEVPFPEVAAVYDLENARQITAPAPEVLSPEAADADADAELFNPETGEKIYKEDNNSTYGQKGGLKEDPLIRGYFSVSKGLSNLENYNVINNGYSVEYMKLDEKDKIKHLKNMSDIISRFISLFNKKPNLVKAYMNAAPASSGGKKSKKQRGGADEMNFSKMYNTQGLIINNNDPIQNALSYNNTADQIPQPFSSGSSGAAAYTSGIDPTFLQDVLPVLAMTGGYKKKSKRTNI
uniref:Uncharacterized protein n=1 Tax=viral metagenome TaxID=1070528 RepID=A0A6C0CSS3_9ZZZZ